MGEMEDGRWGRWREMSGVVRECAVAKEILDL